MSNQNHFRWVADGIEYSPICSGVTQFEVTYGRVSRPIKNFFEECVITANLIANTISKKIMLCFSGGIDSEFVVEVFRQSKIPFHIIIMRFPDQLNRHDIKYAEHYCNKWNLPITYIDLSPIQYYNSDRFLQISNGTKFVYPMVFLQAEMARIVSEDLSGFPIFGSGLYDLKRINSSVWGIVDGTARPYFQIQRYLGIDGALKFFDWTPELIASYIADPCIKRALDKAETNNQNYISDEDIKFNLYSSYINLEPRTKYFGWEKMATIESHLRSNLLQKFKYKPHLVLTPIDQFNLQSIN